MVSVRRDRMRAGYYIRNACLACESCPNGHRSPSSQLIPAAADHNSPRTQPQHSDESDWICWCCNHACVIDRMESGSRTFPIKLALLWPTYNPSEVTSSF